MESGKLYITNKKLYKSTLNTATRHEAYLVVRQVKMNCEIIYKLCTIMIQGWLIWLSKKPEGYPNWIFVIFISFLYDITNT